LSRAAASDWFQSCPPLPPSQDLLFQYLKLKLAFTTRDLMAVFEVYGVLGLGVQTVGLRWLLHVFGEARVLLIGQWPSPSALRHAAPR
jgi:hypothetical protein